MAIFSRDNPRPKLLQGTLGKPVASPVQGKPPVRDTPKPDPSAVTPPTVAPRTPTPQTAAPEIIAPQASLLPDVIAGQSTAPTAAAPTPIVANHRTVDPADTVSGKLTSLLDPSNNNKYLEQAKASALATGNRRGLLNSSMSVQAGEAARIQAALPIAQSDAALVQQQGLANQQVAAQADLANLDSNVRTQLANLAASSSSALANADLATQVSLANAANDLNVSLENLKMSTLVAQSNLDAATRTSLANLDAEMTTLGRNADTVKQLYASSMSAIVGINTSDMSGTDKLASIKKIEQKLAEGIAMAKAANSGVGIIPLNV